jgi:hypothetical protein
MTLASALTLVLLLSVGACDPLLGQGVGHDPSDSPFRDINTHQTLSFLIGRFGGSLGNAGVGAQSTTDFGFRFRNRLSGPLELMIGTTIIPSKRNVIDPTKPDSAGRQVGTVDYNMITADIQLLLSLTGAKTWHTLAPWIAFGFGVETATRPTTDPGGYKAGLNFTFVPSIGLDVHLSRKLGLVFEARDNTIRYEYPLAYFAPTDSTGKALAPVLDPARFSDKQLTHNFTISAGFSYHFTF